MNKSEKHLSKDKTEQIATKSIKRIKETIAKLDFSKLNKKDLKIVDKCKLLCEKIEKNKCYQIVRTKNNMELLTRLADLQCEDLDNYVFKFSNWKVDGLSKEVHFFLDFLNKSEIGMTPGGAFIEYNSGYKLKPSHVISMLRRAYIEEINEVSPKHLYTMIYRFLAAIYSATNDPAVIGRMSDKNQKEITIRNEYMK